MKLQQALEDLRSDEECSKCEYCPLAILIRLNPRTIEQHKMVEVFKYLESEKEKKDIGWEESYSRWVSSGMAVKFANSYSEDKSFRQLKKELFGE